ncbi:very short patch repair endonuclease [Mesorhizobium sp. LNJC384A00]|uniref:very short patch repair endonuclease n=1 Tax=Mesorhizobium sp. LNJC384A00 TaxID=1287268 RepID=UPI001FDAAD7B|nr:very short patch repair endonuclease [Mesorhizobium sp. LNJC384A00]
MAAVRQKSTAIETAVATVLRELRLHYRKNVKSLPGSPDFANRSRRWAVFVNGCFWHHHTGCEKASIPKSNTEFWTTKFRDNRRRDAQAIRRLRRNGYCVIVVWECHKNRIHAKLRKIVRPVE